VGLVRLVVKLGWQVRYAWSFLIPDPRGQPDPPAPRAL